MIVVEQLREEAEQVLPAVATIRGDWPMPKLVMTRSGLLAPHGGAEPLTCGKTWCAILGLNQ
ncbi:hypothetical protein [Saccharopolyspora thermophila]|uniref:hypothetical protein n=1 Tax=Saccharopolyspora thermophila TaxID=89367 RepID=UPI0016642884|nr:hypothetical protein [Saccharopolyspora subtropica]